MKKILVVEDSRLDQLIIERTLKDVVDVEFTKNPVDALNRMGHFPDDYSVVVVDVNLEAGFKGTSMEPYLKQRGIPALYYTGEHIISESFPVVRKGRESTEKLKELVMSMLHAQPIPAHA